jgi:hypothetical protein
LVFPFLAISGLNVAENGALRQHEKNRVDLPPSVALGLVSLSFRFFTLLCETERGNCTAETRRAQRKLGKKSLFEQSLSELGVSAVNYSSQETQKNLFFKEGSHE